MTPKTKTLLISMMMALSLAGMARAEEAAPGPSPSPDVAASLHMKVEDLGSIIRESRGHNASIEDIVVPIAFFLFLLVLVLGSRMLKERTQRQRLELLRTMVEKGQPVPETVVAQILDTNSSGGGSWRSGQPGFRQVRNGYAFTLIGAGLLAHSFLSAGEHHRGIIVGIVFLSLGIGNLVACRQTSGSK